MKNYFQNRQWHETIVALEREREFSRKFQFKSKILLTFCIITFLIMHTSNLKAAAPFCLSIYYNSTEVDAGNFLSSSNTGYCAPGGEQIDIVCADTLLIKTILPDATLYPDFIGFRYKIENLTTSTFTYSSFAFQYTRLADFDVLTRLEFPTCGRYHITNEIANDTDHDGIADSYAAQSYDVFINIFKPINPSTIHVTAIPNPICVGQNVTFTNDYIPCLYQTPIEATTFTIDDYLNKFITIDFGDGTALYTWCQISTTGTRNINLPFTMPAVTHTYTTSGTKHVVIHFSSGDTYSHATTGGAETLLSDGAGCWTADKDLYIIVNPSPIVSISNSSNSLCIGETQTLTASSSPTGCTYVWSPGGATTTSINTTVGGVYSVTATSSLGCTSTASIVLNLQPCCFGDVVGTTSYTYAGIIVPFDISLNPALVTLLSTGTPANITFNGSITISSNLTINNCPNIKWGTDAEFIIPTGLSLTINYSHLYACDAMWKGIILNGSNCNTSNSIIEDAKKAIDKSGCGIINIKTTTFDHDLVGINILGCASNNLDIIENNIFKCSGGNTLRAPYAGSRTSAGIIVNQTQALNIGDYSSNPATANKFEAINSGINCWYGEVNIRNNKFTDIRVYQASLPMANHGNAIYGQSDPNNSTMPARLYVRTNASGRSVDLMPKFLNCDNAINAYGIILEAEKNVIQDCYKSITFTNCYVRQVFIHDNLIDNTAQGITGNSNIYSITKIIDNQINPVIPYIALAPYTAYYNSYGIKIVEGLSPALSILIDQNTIKNGRVGIFVQGTTTNTTVSLNTIDFTSIASLEGKQYGIWSTKCDGSVIYHNTATGNGMTYVASSTPLSSPFRKAGIAFDNSINMVITCNSTIDIGYGMYFQSNCNTASTNIRENIFYNSRFHIFMQKLGTYPSIGNNIGASLAVNANQYTGTVSSGLKSWRETDALEPLTSIPNFYYKTSICDIAPSGSNITLPAKKAVALPASTSATVSTLCWESAGLADPGGGNLQDELVASSLIYTDDAGALWVAQKELYDKIEDNHSIMEDNTILESFYSENSSAALGKIKETEVQFISIADSNTWADSTTLNSKIAENINKNNEIIPIEIQEINAKFIHAMYLRQLETEHAIYNEEEWEEILRLANSCPYIEGTAVYTARVLAAIYDEGSLFNDLELCNNAGFYRLKPLTNKNTFSKENDKEGLIRIIENPVNNQLNLLFQNSNDVTIATIYDLNGIKWREFNIPAQSSSFSIDVSGLFNGVYILKTSHETLYSKEFKFVIAR